MRTAAAELSSCCVVRVWPFAPCRHDSNHLSSLAVCYTAAISYHIISTAITAATSLSASHLSCSQLDHPSTSATLPSAISRAVHPLCISQDRSALTRLTFHCEPATTNNDDTSPIPQLNNKRAQVADTCNRTSQPSTFNSLLSTATVSSSTTLPGPDILGLPTAASFS